MTSITAAPRKQPTRLCKGTDIRTAKPGDKLRFGGGLYLIISPAGTASWQVHYHVAGRHQAQIIGRWPDMNVSEAKEQREAIRRSVHKGSDPRHDQRDERAARIGADQMTVRAVAELWIDSRANVVREWSADYTMHTRLRLENHVFPAIGTRPIGRVTTGEIQVLLTDLAKRYRSQAIHVRQNLQKLFDFAERQGFGVAFNPVRRIAEDLPRRQDDDHHQEQTRAHVETISEAQAVLRAVEDTTISPFAKLAHRLIALTAVRKLEGIEAQWSEITEGPDGMIWTIPGPRMKGRRGKQRDHVIPLSPQAADVFRASRALARALGIKSPAVFPGRGERGGLQRSGLNAVFDRVLPTIGLAGRHTVHGWRATFSTLMNDYDPTESRMIDAMLAHKVMGDTEARYNHAKFKAARLKLATIWSDQLLAGAPDAFALVGVHSNVVQLREAA